MSNSLFLLNEFIQFIKHPTDRRRKKIPSLQKLLAGFIVLDIILLIPAIIIINLMESQIDLNTEHKIEMMLQEYPILIGIGGVIIAPFFEELIFRFFIRLKYAFYIVFPVLVIGRLLNESNFKLNRLLIHWWHYIFPMLFFSSALIFGFVHIYNFENAEQLIWLFPILTLPQILLGLIFGFTRTTYGIKYSMLFHAFHNGVLLIPMVIYYMLK